MPAKALRVAVAAALLFCGTSRAAPITWHLDLANVIIRGVVAPVTGSFNYDPAIDLFSDISIVSPLETYTAFIGQSANSTVTGLVFGRTSGETQSALLLAGVTEAMLVDATAIPNLQVNDFADYTCLSSCLTGFLARTNWQSGRLIGAPASLPEPGTLSLLLPLLLLISGRTRVLTTGSDSKYSPSMPSFTSSGT